MNQLSEIKNLIFQNKIATIITLIILIGLMAGLLIIRNPQILRSRASENIQPIHTAKLRRGDTPDNTDTVNTTTPHLQITVDPGDLPTN